MNKKLIIHNGLEMLKKAFIVIRNRIEKEIFIDIYEVKSVRCVVCGTWRAKDQNCNYCPRY